MIVTGAGRGIGRSHALEFARQGARVVVNDVGTHEAERVATEIRAAGGEAIANGDDVSDWDGAGRLVVGAIDAFGDLHVVVNNAGILRDRMLVNMSIDEWDAVVKVHLRGTFAPTRHAIEHWRAQSKAGVAVDARVINTSSGSGLWGNPSQSNYGAAKAGIAAFTIIASRELARYGVTVNAVAPAALTRMTAEIPRYQAAADPDADWNEFDPDNISPVVVWLGSAESTAITGRVFDVNGGRICIAEGWDRGPQVDKGARWDASELGAVLPDLVARAKPLTPVRPDE